MPLHSLPLDVIHTLCTFLDTPSLIQLSLTSSVFYPYTQRNIYRHISIYSYPSAVKCIQALHNNPLHALFVRSFSLRLDQNAILLNAFVNKLAFVLNHMSNISSLDLVLPPSASRVLATALRPNAPNQNPSLPYYRLTHFSCSFSLNDSVCAFLQRTPALKHLQLGDSSGSTVSTLSSPSWQSTSHLLPDSALPNLTYFMGPCADAKLIVPGRPLDSVHLHSGDISEDVLDALARSSSPITIFGALTSSLSPSILTALANSLPHLHYLQIMTMYHHSSNQPANLFYAEAFHILSSLRELVTAELAGIRWAPLKKNANGSRTGAQSRTGIPQPAPVSTAVYGY